jgi:hypothetical protein
VSGATFGVATVDPTAADTATVHTFDAGGAAADRAFNITVTC